MSDAPEAPIDFHIEYREGFAVVVYDSGGVRPANETDVVMWDRIGRLEMELERAKQGKTIRDFHGDDVWRDDEGTIWVRQEQLIDAVKFNSLRALDLRDGEADEFRAAMEGMRK